MAWSLAADLDLRYDARRPRPGPRGVPGGPQGIFLKRGSGGLTVDPARRLPVDPPGAARGGAALLRQGPGVSPRRRPGGLAPGNPGPPRDERGDAEPRALVRVRRGEAARASRPGAALGTVLVLLLGTVAPVYLLWPAPEIFGLALVALALSAWAAERPLLSAVLFGIAGYVKPPNVLMAAPLGLAPLVAGLEARGAGRPRARARGVAEARGGARGDRAGLLRAQRRRHRGAQLPGRGAEDLLRPLPLRREGDHLRRGRASG